MCKQKPSLRSSQGNVDVPTSSAGSSTPVAESSAMPSEDAPYRDKKTMNQHTRGATNFADERMFTRADTDSKELRRDSDSATVDPWSPVPPSDVVPDPYCPRRSAKRVGKDRAVHTDSSCGSQESLIPQSDGSCDGTSAVACSSLGTECELDLIRFSPAVDTDKCDSEEEEENATVRRDSCIFSCDGAKFEDEGSEADEFEDAIDSFNADPYAFCGTVPLPGYERADPSLSREASDLFLDVILPKRLGLPQVKSAAEISVASSSISQKSMPICRICHLPATDEDRLMSPCRCSGTMRFIHNSCLMKWLEISSTRNKRPPSCELCLYQYHRHKKFKVRQWQFPQCSRQDKVLHVIFVTSLIVMLGCATATILCFKQDRGIRNSLEKSELTKSEVITLVCGVFFFVAFFVAMYVEVKSRNTIYKLCVKFVYLNQQWYIDEYDKRKDVQPVPV